MSEMRFLEKLLDGVEVEWKALGDVAKYSDVRIDSNRVNKENYVGVDNLLQNRAGKTASNYVPTEGRLIQYLPGDVLIGNIRPYLKKIWLADQAGGTNGDVLVIRSTHKSLGSGYLYQVLTDENFFAYNMQHAKGAKMPRGDKTKILEYLIPIPCPDNPKKSLEIQAQIVRILDAFTELTTELTTELNARKKQYKHYRDQLLSFEEGEVEWKTLGELCSIGVGQAPQDDEIGEYPFVNAGTTPSGYLSAYNTEPDTITTPSRGQGGIGFVGYQTKRFWCGPLCYRIRSISKLISTRFLYHFMANSMKDIVGLANMTGVPALNKKELVGFSVPIPSPDEQARIVAILDKFDALTNSISEGLPREIELRNMQYAYYRDLLFNFKGAVHAD